MSKGILVTSIKRALENLRIDKTKISKINLEHPEEFSNGDYSTNIAMVLSKQVAQNPRELAEKNVEEIKNFKQKKIKKVEVEDLDIINFYLSKEIFVEKTKEVRKKKKKFGQNKKLK